MKHITSLVIVATLLSTASISYAASHAAAPAMDAKKEMTASSALPMAEGEIRKIDLENKKITLKHGVIKNLDMPPMSMVFQVKDAALLDKLSAGDKVKFTADMVGNGMFVMSIEKAK
jgi:Cu(I)/Ag(I) efflux system periplasmic protein CusF